MTMADHHFHLKNMDETNHYCIPFFWHTFSEYADILVRNKIAMQLKLLGSFPVANFLEPIQPTLSLVGFQYTCGIESSHTIYCYVPNHAMDIEKGGNTTVQDCCII